MSSPTPVDPPQMPSNPAFAQGMIAEAGARMLYIGGQNGVDGAGELAEGLEAQTSQALRNVLAVLSEAGSGPEQVVSMTIHLAVGVDPNEAYAASASVWGRRRTAVTVLSVTPARPGALVEITAIAVVPNPVLPDS
ncbi:RidA family protein [Herbiconiux sp.]|uniref:RidA family protein n=1 Tax=Herbiconiux sp. TaxID=1871186 RepID=UPI0025BFBAEC|nr:RidA family protein [Herbiconiux sp.]